MWLPTDSVTDWAEQVFIPYRFTVSADPFSECWGLNELRKDYRSSKIRTMEDLYNWIVGHKTAGTIKVSWMEESLRADQWGGPTLGHVYPELRALFIEYIDASDLAGMVCGLDGLTLLTTEELSARKHELVGKYYKHANYSRIENIPDP